MNTAAMLQICPRCNCLSLIEDESQADVTDFCTPCGYFAGEDYRCDLPHFNYSYRWSKADLENLADLRGKHGEPDISNLAAAEAWIKSCESDDFEFTAISDSINTTKRIQENASKNQILISKEAYARVEQRADAKPYAPLVVKGNNQLIDVFEVKGLK